MEDEMAKLQLELKVVIVILQHSDQDVATTEHKLMNFYESWKLNLINVKLRSTTFWWIAHQMKGF